MTEGNRKYIIDEFVQRGLPFEISQLLKALSKARNGNSLDLSLWPYFTSLKKEGVIEYCKESGMYNVRNGLERKSGF